MAGLYDDTVALRFIALTDAPDDLTDPDPCWLWQGARHSKGGTRYGKFWLNGRMVNAHKASYEIFKGEVPAGLVVGHKCNIEGCVSPHHLEAVTQKRNMEYCIESGRHNNFGRA